MRTGIVESVHELRSITVGTMSGNGTRARRSRSRSRARSGRTTTFGRSRFGVWSMGADARLPWNVWPTTTVSIAPLASCDIFASGLTSADAKRFATFCAASRAPRRAGRSRPGCGSSRTTARSREGRSAASGSGTPRSPSWKPAVDAEPVTPFPFRTVMLVSRGAGTRCLSFSPSATAVAFSEDSTSGCVNVCTARVMFSESWSGRRSPRGPRSGSGRPALAAGRTRTTHTRGPCPRRRSSRRPVRPRRCW